MMRFAPCAGAGKARSAATRYIPRLALRLAGLPNFAGCVARVRREAPLSGCLSKQRVELVQHVVVVIDQQ
ncbi:hypothetical protein, partial [Klebsiella pneumoniae]|uniref:hypothetical protein n=1 Tax=Klebsiella pneumoniae TaxID=573 RepID=UPI001BAB004D